VTPDFTNDMYFSDNLWIRGIARTDGHGDLDESEIEMGWLGDGFG